MKKKENERLTDKKSENNIEYWSDELPYYIIYQDKYFMKNIYAQIYQTYPDIGQIAYIGASTKRKNRDYFVNNEMSQDQDLNKHIVEKEEKEGLNKNIRNGNTNKAGMNISDSDEESEIREYANIHEIKEMNNMIFYKELLRKIVCACKLNKCSNICHVRGKIEIYDKYKEEDDLFVRINNNCVWIKKEFLDTSALNLSFLLDDVHLVGFILEDETIKHPRIIKAIAIYT